MSLSLCRHASRTTRSLLKGPFPFLSGNSRGRYAYALRSNRDRRLGAATPDSTQLQGLFFSACHAYINARNSTTASSTHSLPCFTELSVLPRLHNSIMYDVVHNSTVLINRCQHDPLCLSPFVLLIPFAALFPTHIPDVVFIVCRHNL